jgi:hypothetical protein
LRRVFYAGGAFAQASSNKPIMMIVGFRLAGGTDCGGAP